MRDNPMTIEAIRERAGAVPRWLEGHRVSHEEADEWWQLKRDLAYLLSLHEFNNRAYTDVRAVAR